MLYFFILKMKGKLPYTLYLLQFFCLMVMGEFKKGDGRISKISGDSD